MAAVAAMAAMTAMTTVRKIEEHFLFRRSSRRHATKTHHSLPSGRYFFVLLAVIRYLFYIFLGRTTLIYSGWVSEPNPKPQVHYGTVP
jgi:hypothetical protein